MAKKTEKVGAERLKELLLIAKKRGLAKTQEDFAQLIGVSKRGVQSALYGNCSADNMIVIAENMLENAGIHVKNAYTIEQRLDELDKRLTRIEKSMQLSDETL